MKETTKEDSLRGYNTAIESLRKSNSDEAMELLRKSFSMEMQDPKEAEKTVPEIINELRELLSDDNVPKHAEESEPKAKERNKMTKAAMKRLEASNFYDEVYGVIAAWDYYLRINDRKSADEMMHRWSMAKLALKFITGKSYGFTRDDESFGLVNEADCNDVLFKEAAFKRAVEA